MELDTTRFGSLTLDNDERIFTFPEGILGFSDSRRYVVLDNPTGGVFQWLQSVDQPDLAFVICDPMVFKPDYVATVSKSDLEKIGAKKAGEIQSQVIVTVPDVVEDMTANLQGPIIFNLETLLARQVVLPDDAGYVTNYRIIPEGA